MIIYVAEQGCHSDTYFAGAFDSVERAVAALDKAGVVWTHYKREGKYALEEWHNNKDWGEYVTILAVEVQAEGPVYEGGFIQDIEIP